MQHTREQFTQFMEQLKTTNNTLSYFCDFQKIKCNVDEVAIDLNQLNYLIGAADLDTAVRILWERNPRAFAVMEILIAVRASENRKVIGAGGTVMPIKEYFQSVEGVVAFVHETGLDRVFQDRQVKNLVDYVFGIETGLDTNARKNRGGVLMERQVASIFEREGITFRQEVYSTEFPPLAVLGEDKKRFDFLIQTLRSTYLIEVNFYNGGGSKLNEVARSYTDLAPKVNHVEGFEFVWITDGVGWRSASNKLEEAFYAIPHVYNLTTIDDFLRQVKSEL